ncbi:synapsin-1-like [Motacilla alba alba]|uniref:synapsin-1-like n=1 Tax=Motacilla alba alba TaxID=1094192 RepID=UPI0018D4EEDC|nr:synapsin-1-like [Motacilla alba alba]
MKTGITRPVHSLLLPPPLQQLPTATDDAAAGSDCCSGLPVSIPRAEGTAGHIWNTAAGAGSSPDPAEGPHSPVLGPSPVSLRPQADWAGRAVPGRGRPAAREQGWEAGPGGIWPEPLSAGPAPKPGLGALWGGSLLPLQQGCSDISNGILLSLHRDAKAAGGWGRAGDSSRSSEGTRVSAFPSKCRHLSNVISEMILLNQESVTQGRGAQPPPGSSQAQPSAAAGGGRRLPLPWPRSLPLSRAQPPARPAPDTQQPRDAGPGARGSGRPSRPVLGLSPVGRGRGRDRGDWGDARLRAELKAVLVCLSVCVCLCACVCLRV